MGGCLLYSVVLRCLICLVYFVSLRRGFVLVCLMCFVYFVGVHVYVSSTLYVWEEVSGGDRNERVASSNQVLARWTIHIKVVMMVMTTMMMTQHR